jgi:hypothetical protein
MTAIVVRTRTGVPDVYVSTLSVAHGLAVADAVHLGCPVPPEQALVEWLEEGRPWRMVGGDGSEATYRLEPLL